MNRASMYSNVSAATRKSQSVVHTCVERMEVVWVTGSFGNEEELRPTYNITQNYTTLYVGKHSEVETTQKS
jgi:hypothetical protein